MDGRLEHIVVCAVGERRRAVPLRAVDSVRLRLPTQRSPPGGDVLTLEQTTWAVVDLRPHEGSPVGPKLSDHFVFLRGVASPLVVVVDRVLGVTRPDPDRGADLDAGPHWFPRALAWAQARMHGTAGDRA